MKLVPLFDRVVLKKMVEEETTASGIVLPGKGDKETAVGYATVVATLFDRTPFAAEAQRMLETAAAGR